MLRRGLRHGCSAAAASWAPPAPAPPAARPRARFSSSLGLPGLPSAGRGLMGAGPDRGRGQIGAGSEEPACGPSESAGPSFGEDPAGAGAGPSARMSFPNAPGGSTRAAPLPGNRGRKGRGPQGVGDSPRPPERRTNASLLQQVLGPTLEDVQGPSPGAPRAAAAFRKPSGAQGLGRGRAGTAGRACGKRVERPIPG